MAPKRLDYSDARAVAHAFSRAGCGCSPRAQGLGSTARIDCPPRAQGLVNTPGDYRLYLKQLQTVFAQLDPKLSDDPEWKALKTQFEEIYDEYRDVGWTEFYKLSYTTWERLDDINKALQGWAERLRKKGQDVAPLALTPPPKPLTEQVSDAAKAASGFLGGKPDQSLGDRFLPSLSTGTKVFLGLAAGALVLSQAKPVLERVLPARKAAALDVPDRPLTEPEWRAWVKEHDERARARRSAP